MVKKNTMEMLKFLDGLQDVLMQLCVSKCCVRV